MSYNDELTMRQKFTCVVKKCNLIEQSPERHDSESYQRALCDTLKQLNTLQSMVRSISLFSVNEQLSEVNTSYLPFATLPYYEAVCYQKLLTDPRENFNYEFLNRSIYKFFSLKRAKVKILEFLTQVDAFQTVLSSEQLSLLNSLKSYDPSNEDVIASRGDHTQRRASKIANYKIEKELRGKLAVLDGFYANHAAQSLDTTYEDILEVMDEETVRSLYIDQLRLFSINAYKDLELIAMELQVLENEESHQDLNLKDDSRSMSSEQIDTFEYTPKLEADPTRHKNVSDLISKRGKILQPFVITSNKQKLRQEVFGTGQVLPTMSIEEYLDYELANGKMASSGSQDPAPGGNDDETDDSDEEMRKRNWDDWKDENRKGSGNMKANMG